MEPIVLNSNTSRVRLTKEELMAGKCFPDPPHPAEPDPRFKSPDLVLERHPNSLIKKNGNEYTTPLAKLTKDFQDFEQRYNSEIADWKKYEQAVNVWKKQVVEMIEQLRAEADKNKGSAQELKVCREELQRKNELLQFLKSKLIE